MKFFMKEENLNLFEKRKSFFLEFNEFKDKIQ